MVDVSNCCINREWSNNLHNPFKFNAIENNDDIIK